MNGRFDFKLPTRIVFGAGRLPELGDLARSLGDVSRVLVVSDPGVVSAGHTQRGIDSLHAAGLATQLFDGLQENPTTAHVEAGLNVAQDFSPDAIVGLGGGSSMDCAKGINFLYSCGGRMQDYWGRDKATGPLLPMIAVPTTAGTGSETQSFALISDAETHVKMACGDKRAAFRVALLDPELTVTQPRACDGADRVRCAGTRRRNGGDEREDAVVAGVQPRGVAASGAKLSACDSRARRPGRARRNAARGVLRGVGDREFDARRGACARESAHR